MNYISLSKPKVEIAEELSKNLIKLNKSQINEVVRTYNSFIPCKSCGKPLGYSKKKKKYCNVCADVVDRINKRKAFQKFYNRNKFNRLVKIYKPLLDKIPLDSSEVIASLMEIVNTKHSKGFSRIQLISASAIYTCRRLNLPYTISNVASWLGIHNRVAGKLWWKLKNHEPFKSVNVEYHRKS